MLSVPGFNVKVQVAGHGWRFRHRQVHVDSGADRQAAQFASVAATRDSAPTSLLRTRSTLTVARGVAPGASPGRRDLRTRGSGRDDV